MAQESSLSAVKNLDVFTEDPLLQRLYRVFTVFNDNQCHISPHQAHFIIGQLLRLNRGTEQAHNGLSTLIRSDAITFHDLLRICDLLFPDRKQFEPLVDRIFERYVQHIICKGFLLHCSKSNKKKLCLVGSNNSKWQACWCTITPGAIHLWPLHKSTTVKNRRTVAIDQTSSVQVGTFDEKRFTWLLIQESKQKCEFGHFDELQRKHWIFAMNLAIEQRSVEDLQKYDMECSRNTECRVLRDKNLSWRLALECENERLMQLLNDQRRALHDEEIVRTIAARMLDEERERREKLEEKLQDLVRNLDENCNGGSHTAKSCLEGSIKANGKM
uniref:PH domain-containing protein n=1 Tax=Elaeophora elaphi TaxID=1147741 RepID=A0A0R3RPD0_9BILA